MGTEECKHFYQLYEHDNPKCCYRPVILMKNLSIIFLLIFQARNQKCNWVRSSGLPSNFLWVESAKAAQNTSIHFIISISFFCVGYTIFISFKALLNSLGNFVQMMKVLIKYYVRKKSY